MTDRNVEQYERAKAAIRNYLRDGDWHASREIHEQLADDVPKDWIYGAVKKELGIEHRRMQGRFYWRLRGRAASTGRTCLRFPACGSANQRGSRPR